MLTAPIRRAEASTSSSSGMTSNFNGIVTLAPPKVVRSNERLDQLEVRRFAQVVYVREACLVEEAIV